MKSCFPFKSIRNPQTSVTLTLHTYQNVPVTNLEQQSLGQEGLSLLTVGGNGKETTIMEESGSYCFTAAETNTAFC